MVADGVHILLAIALTFVAFRSTDAAPYLLAALAASVPDVDRFVFDPLIELGYVQGAIWAHRGITHSVFLVLAVVAVLSLIGPWRPAALGAGSHVAFDLLTGGVRLFAPISPVMVGISGGWLLFNVVGSLLAGAILVVAVLRMDAEACSVSVGRSHRDQ